MSNKTCWLFIQTTRNVAIVLRQIHQVIIVEKKKGEFNPTVLIKMKKKVRRTNNPKIFQIENYRDQRRKRELGSILYGN